MGNRLLVIATALAAHQKVSMGMSQGSPDTCKCGEKVYPFISDEEINVRRDMAFAMHQAEKVVEWELVGRSRAVMEALKAKSRGGNDNE